MFSTFDEQTKCNHVLNLIVKTWVILPNEMFFKNILKQNNLNYLKKNQTCLTISEKQANKLFDFH